MNMLWFFLPGIIYLGIITSYTDIKFGKIKNRDIFIGICYSFTAYSALITYFAFTTGINHIYIAQLGTNTLLSLGAAFLLWDIGIWSAGDGKLFFAFTLLIPLEVYQIGRYDWIPSLAFLFNIFIIGLFLMILLIIKKARWHNYKKAVYSFFKDFFSPENLFRSIIYLFVVFWIVEIILSIFNMGSNVLLKYILTILILSKLVYRGSKSIKAMNKNTSLYAFIFLAVLRFLIDSSIYSIDFLKNFFMLILFWKIIHGLLNNSTKEIGKDLFSKKIHIKSLKPGMVLSDKVSRIKGLSKKEIEKAKKGKKELVVKGNYAYIFGSAGENFLNLESEGLTESQIEKIKKIGFRRVRISYTLPFAPIVFIAVISTILVKGNILILLSFLF